MIKFFKYNLINHEFIAINFNVT